MAPEWEAALGMELGMGSHYHHAPPSAAASPMNQHHHHHSAYSHSQPPHQYHFYGGAAGGDGADPMRVDEMLDLSSHLGAHDFFSGANNGAADNAPAQPAAAAASSSDHQHHHPSSFNLSFADEFYLPVPLRRQNELVHLRGGVGGGVVSASSGSGGAAEHMFRDYGVC
uniref:Uncharacterized protein n=1 Tax=Aegilops tauschii TaxID=37682 RepID=N1QSI4_AEGTA